MVELVEVGVLYGFPLGASDKNSGNSYTDGEWDSS